ncbi:uncharacterized protein [Nicotiana tomentosiformis]|uniref:uncharacterized protein n=1 Tax=Nicotiana tomentosiformis TaxID=4098 RepID=UPI00388C9A2A
MPEPRDIHELKSLQRKLAYLRRFMSNLAGRCQPFSRLMKKGVPFKWDQACSNAFESIKSYFMKPLILAAPILGKPLILYISAQERSVGALLAQENSEGKENSLYYLSRMMTANKLNYSPIEKLCLALVFSIQKLKHYFQAHGVRLVSKANPIKFVMSKSILNHPIPDDWELTDELPDEDAMVIEVQPPWKMYFDGAAHRRRAGASVVFVTSQGELVINQLLGSYEVKKPELRPYHDYAKNLMGWVGDVTIQHVPRKENKKVDALIALASSLTLPDQAQVTVCQKWVISPPNKVEGEGNELKHLVVVSEAEKEEWRQPISDYLSYGILPENPRRRTEICHHAPRFLYYNDTLYRRSFEGVLLRCLGEEEALQALQEAYSGKVVSKSKRDWHDRMEEALWAYRTTHRMPTQATPYALVYGVEVVLPLERQIPSLRLVIQEGITDEENTRLRLAELEALDEKRLESQQSLECYQARLSRAFNKRILPRSFQVGDQVLAIQRPIITFHKPVGKFTSKWDGSYVIQEAYSSGAYKLVDADGMRIGPINGKFLKKYYP